MLKRIAFFALVFALATGAAKAATWQIDVVHSNIGFKVSHMVISKVSGKFDDFQGTVEFEKGQLADASAVVTVKMASIDTDDEKRDDHLRSADFFDVEKFPTMKFVSTKVIPGEGNKFQLVGELTIKDVTREVTFDAEFNGVATGFGGERRAGFSAETTINRQDFNVEWSKTLDAGGLVVGDDVDLEIDIELVEVTEEG